MKISKRLTRLQMVSILTVVATCIVLGLGGVAFANHSWNGYHWARTTNPFTLLIGDNVSSAWDSTLDTTVSDWSQSSVLDLSKVAGSANPRNCRPTAGRVEVCNSTYGNNGWLGVAQIWITGGTHITQGTVKLNDTYFNTPTYNQYYWRNLVSCQEVGHTLGLDHQDTNFDNPNLGTCMDYTSNPQGPPDNEHPNQHDYDELVTIYNHLDSTTTVGTPQTIRMPPAMTDIELEGPGQWGRLVSQSASRSDSTYEADFGNGFKIVTHVTWGVDNPGRGRQ